MASPIIGITCSTVAGASAPPADQLGQAYARAVATVGGIPVLIPNVPVPNASALIAALDGLLLSGGRDVAPERYGAEDRHPATEVDLLRDEIELQLIHAALAQRIPILGICRGIQSLNVALGGTLYQDLPSERPGPIAHRQNEPRHVATHRLVIEPDSLAAGALGVTVLAVNTFHHQAVKEAAPTLRVTGHAEDGLIEAVEAPDFGFVLGVQYHPEEMVETCAASLRLFRAFVEAAAEAAG